MPVSLQKNMSEQFGRRIPQLMIDRISRYVKKLITRATRNQYLNEQQIVYIESKLNYEFNDKKLLVTALKHRSFLSVTNESRLLSNERLELLGDAVLGMIVVEHLFKKFDTKEEGEITAMKSLLVSRKILARIARKIGLGDAILMNEAEEKSGGRFRPSILADVFEAIVGAIYLDGGLEIVRRFIHEKLFIKFEQLIAEEQYKNFKSMLLEFSQSKNLGIPRYIVRQEQGPDHHKMFTIEVLINKKPLGVGKGNSKKKAEQIAAKNALKKFKVIT